MRLLLKKRVILLLSALAIAFWVATWFITAATVHCGPETTSSTAQCGASSGSAGVVGAVIFALLALILSVIVWVMGMVKTARIQHWLWFVIVFIIPPFGSFFYGLLGPDATAHENLTYIEGTPPTPVTP